MSVTEKNDVIKIDLSLHPNDSVLDGTKPSTIEVYFDFDSAFDPDHWIWMSSDSEALSEPWFKLTPEEAIDLAHALVQTVRRNTNAIS